MRVSTSRKDHYWILVCEGDTVGVLPGPLFDVQKALIEGARDIILDFESMRFLDSSGAKAFEDTYRLVREGGGRLGIVAPPPDVRVVLKLSKTLRDIPVYHSMEEAVSKLDLIDYQSDAGQENIETLVVWQKELPVAGELRRIFKTHPLNPRFHMRPVREPAEVTDTLLAEKVDCVLIDATCRMFQVANLIESVLTDSSMPRVPILVVSADEDLEEAELMIRHGAHELLRFPFKSSEALVRIQNVISRFKDHSPYFPPAAVAHPRGMRA